MVNITINGKAMAVKNGTTIMEAATQLGIPIPHLCYLKDINEIGACRMCTVEVEGTDRLVTSCNTGVVEGMAIHTNTPKVREARKTNLRLILSQHNSTCTTCIRSGNCELQRLAHDLNIHYQPYPVKPERSHLEMDVPVIREASKCIKCMRCIQVCDKIQGMHIWDVVGTGSRTTVDVAVGRYLKDSDYTFCGQCVTHCPTGALTARDDTNRVLDALADPEITTVVQVAPAVRVAWAESFQLPAAQATTGHMVSALRQIGFDYIFDTNFTADLTIMEEGSEFVERFTHRDQFSAVRGDKPWKEAIFHVPGIGSLRVAVVSGLGNTRALMDALAKGDVQYDFVEVMACPGGCAGGGGQPIHEGQEYASYRGDQLWNLDANAAIRFSHENPDVQALYQEYLGAPLGEKSHHLLHTDHNAWQAHPK